MPILPEVREWERGSARKRPDPAGLVVTLSLSHSLTLSLCIGARGSWGEWGVKPHGRKGQAGDGRRSLGGPEGLLSSGEPVRIRAGAAGAPPAGRAGCQTNRPPG